MPYIAAIYMLLFVWIDIAQLILTLLLGLPLLSTEKTRRYWINQLLSIDQRVNVLCGGDPDETISSRLGKARHNSKAAYFFANIVDALFFWEPQHCDKNEEKTEGDGAVL